MSDFNEVAVTVMERLAVAVRADIGLSDVLESAREELQGEALVADARGDFEHEVRELNLLAGLTEAWAREQHALRAWGAAIETGQEAADAGLKLARLYGGVRARLIAVEAERDRLAAAVATLGRSAAQVDGRLEAGDATVASLVTLVERLAARSSQSVRFVRDEDGRTVGAEIEEVDALSGVATGAEPARFSKAERRETVATLREQGHSLRAIAKEVGVSQTQVANDLRAAVNDGLTVEPPVTVVGRDGRRYAGRPNRPAAAAGRENGEAEGGDEAA